MEALAHGHASYAHCYPQRLILCLEARLFLPHLWQQIRDWFSRAGSITWLSAPFRVMTAEGPTPDSPRWKQVGMDVLSWLIFLVMVPAYHPLVAFWQAVDWAAINRICAPCYHNGQRGQRAWAPAQMFALLILFFVLPVPSESELLRTVAIVPLYRWFCGFGLFSSLPDHSTLHTFRKRVGVERFEAILTWVVGRCLEAGLIANHLAHFDMMGVAASARTWTPYEKAVLLTQALIRYLELAEEEKAPDEPLPEALRQLVAEIAITVLGNERLKEDAKAPSRVLRSIERWNLRRQGAKGQALWEMALEEAVQTLLSEEESPPPEGEDAFRRWLKGRAQQLKALLPHARGDLDARIGKVSDVLFLCGYWLGFLVDGVRSVITAVRVVPLNVDQRTQMIPALDAHRKRVGAYPKQVTADSAQDYYSVHRALDERRIEGHIASRDHKAVGGGLSSDHFTWDEKGQLLCPEGKVMRPGKPRQDGLIPFKGSDCSLCQCKAECLPRGQQPDGPRVIHLEPAAHQRWQKNREHTRTKAYKEAQQKRFAKEGLFGLAKRLHGAEKMPYRSEPMNQIAGLMIGIVMDLGILARQRRAKAST